MPQVSPSAPLVLGVDLYSAVLTTAPFVLLTVSGGITFGPAPVWLANDVAAAVLVTVGAAVSLIVLGHVITDMEASRSTVIGSGALALFLLLLHVGGEIIGKYRPLAAFDQ